MRVHTDEWAAKSAGAVNAPAYTAGRTLPLARGDMHRARKPAGRLLAHELTHVLQQGTTPAPDSTLLRQEAGVDVDTDNDEMEPVDVDFDKETPPVEVEDFGGERRSCGLGSTPRHSGRMPKSIPSFNSRVPSRSWTSICRMPARKGMSSCSATRARKGKRPTI